MKTRNLDHNERIEIHATQNGFLVRPSVDRGNISEPNDWLVFQSFASLAEWLGFHFSHRESVILTDIPSDYTR